MMGLLLNQVLGFGAGTCRSINTRIVFYLYARSPVVWNAGNVMRVETAPGSQHDLFVYLGLYL